MQIRDTSDAGRRSSRSVCWLADGGFNSYIEKRGRHAPSAADFNEIQQSWLKNGEIIRVPRVDARLGQVDDCYVHVRALCGDHRHGGATHITSTNTADTKAEASGGTGHGYGGEMWGGKKRGTRRGDGSRCLRSQSQMEGGIKTCMIMNEYPGMQAGRGAREGRACVANKYGGKPTTK